MKTAQIKNMKPTHKELFDELEIAMTSNPDLSMFDVIRYVTEKTFPNRFKYQKIIQAYDSYTEYKEHWKLTDSDILKALKQYNSRV